MMSRQVYIYIALILMAVLLSLPAGAQDNILTNGGFEGNYSADSTGVPELNFAPGWRGWWTETPKTAVWQNERPNGYPHTGSTKRSGNRSQNVGRGFATFTAAASQTIQVNPGDRLRGSAWVYIENAGDKGARARVGFGNNGITNPQDSSITWSPFMRDVNSWQQVVVEFTATTANVTFFVFMTQDAPNDPNQFYIDDASVVVIGQGPVPTTIPPTSAESPTPTLVPTNTPPPFVPFVNPQAPNEQGQLIHSVISGDTLISIAVAYGVPASIIREQNGLQTDILQIGQQLLIREAVPATNPPPVQVVATQPPTATPVAVGVVPTATGIAIQVAPPTATGFVVQAAPPTVTPNINPPQPAATENIAPPTIQPAVVLPTITLTPASGAVATGNTGFQGDPSPQQAVLCGFIYNDANESATFETGESFVGGGTITLQAIDGTEIGRATTPENEFCFDPVEPGRYTISIVPPQGFNSTTANSLLTEPGGGVRFRTAFGVAQGTEVASAPPAATSIGGDSGTSDVAPSLLPAQIDPVSIVGTIMITFARALMAGG
ncbi:MAG: LysM peptidoglycan-binding domain-containing protein [Aggregatilineales bacterium]